MAEESRREIPDFSPRPAKTPPLRRALPPFLSPPRLRFAHRHMIRPFEHRHSCWIGTRIWPLERAIEARVGFHPDKLLDILPSLPCWMKPHSPPNRKRQAV